MPNGIGSHVWLPHGAYEWRPATVRRLMPERQAVVFGFEHGCAGSTSIHPVWKLHRLPRRDPARGGRDRPDFAPCERPELNQENPQESEDERNCLADRIPR